MNFTTLTAVLHITIITNHAQLSINIQKSRLMYMRGIHFPLTYKHCYYIGDVYLFKAGDESFTTLDLITSYKSYAY